MEDKKITEAITAIHSHRHMKSYGSPRMIEERRVEAFGCGHSLSGTANAHTGHICSSSKSVSALHHESGKNARIAPNHLAEACAPNAPEKEKESVQVSMIFKTHPIYIGFFRNVFTATAYPTLYWGGLAHIPMILDPSVRHKMTFS